MMVLVAANVVCAWGFAGKKDAGFFEGVMIGMRQ